MTLVLRRVTLSIFQVDEVADWSGSVEVQLGCCANWLQMHFGKMRGYMKRT